MKKIELLRLKKEIETELEKTEKIKNELLEIICSKEIKEKYYLYSISFLLHNFYCSIENVFSRIAPVMNGGKPKGGDFHRRLLENMSMEIDGIRPAVIKEQTLKILLEFMKFRHLVRHMYAFDLDLEKTEELANKTNSAFELIKKDVLDFIKFIERLCTKI